jgi:hypothetical protein
VFCLSAISGSFSIPQEEFVEQKGLEFHWEALNAFTHPQFTLVPEMRVTSSGPIPGALSIFLNRDFTDSGARSI